MNGVGPNEEHWRRSNRDKGSGIKEKTKYALLAIKNMDVITMICIMNSYHTRMLGLGKNTL